MSDSTPSKYKIPQSAFQIVRPADATPHGTPSKPQPQRPNQTTPSKDSPPPEPSQSSNEFTLTPNVTILTQNSLLDYQEKHMVKFVNKAAGTDNKPDSAEAMDTNNSVTDEFPVTEDVIPHSDHPQKHQKNVEETPKLSKEVTEEPADKYNMADDEFPDRINREHPPEVVEIHEAPVTKKEKKKEERHITIDDMHIEYTSSVDEFPILQPSDVEDNNTGDDEFPKPQISRRRSSCLLPPEYHEPEPLTEEPMDKYNMADDEFPEPIVREHPPDKYEIHVGSFDVIKPKMKPIEIEIVDVPEVPVPEELKSTDEYNYAEDEILIAEDIIDQTYHTTRLTPRREDMQVPQQPILVPDEYHIEDEQCEIPL